jgi:hypothetical protein
MQLIKIVLILYKIQMLTQMMLVVKEVSYQFLKE